MLRLSLNELEILLVADTVTKEISEAPEGPLQSISDGLLSGFLDGEGFGPHTLRDAITHVFVVGPVLELNTDKCAHTNVKSFTRLVDEI